MLPLQTGLMTHLEKTIRLNAKLEITAGQGKDGGAPYCARLRSFLD
jgi:hypothetical protein